MSDTKSTVTAQVIASGVSYFEVREVLDANGSARKDQNGNDIGITVRHEALRGDVVEMSQHEYDRLVGLDAVREPSGASLFPAPRATPFGVPIVDPATGLAAAAAGPIMGDPRPAGPDVDALEIARGRPGTLTTEERERLDRVARGEEDLNGNPLGEDDDAEHLHVEAEQPNSGASRAEVDAPTAGSVPRPQGNDLGAEALTEVDGDYEERSKSVLLAEVERRGITDKVEGSGTNGAIIKDDLIIALEEDDASQ